jgi:hypothetical protein
MPGLSCAPAVDRGRVRNRPAGELVRGFSSVRPDQAIGVMASKVYGSRFLAWRCSYRAIISSAWAEATSAPDRA